MSIELAFGEYPGVILLTRVVEDENSQYTAELDVMLDGHDDAVTVPYRLYGRAEEISVAAISRLGFKGLLSEIHANTSSLTGMRVTLVVKQGKEKTNGGHFTNYIVLPLRKVSPTKVIRDLKFGETPAAGGSWH
jgi:hypothetical protein